MVKKSLSLTIDGRTYQVEVLRPGVISVDGSIYSVEMNEKGVVVNDQLMVASLSGGLAIVDGKLFETTWNVE